MDGKRKLSKLFNFCLDYARRGRKIQYIFIYVKKRKEKERLCHVNVITRWFENERRLGLIKRVRLNQSRFHPTTRPSNIFSVFRFRVEPIQGGEGSDRLPSEILSTRERERRITYTLEIPQPVLLMRHARTNAIRESRKTCISLEIKIESCMLNLVLFIKS